MFRFTATALAVSALLAATPAIAQPNAYAFDKSHANLTFAYDHLGYSTTDGRFADWDGALVIDVDAPENSTISVTVQVGSMDTFWEKRDEHLLSADFFDAGNHPTATFVSNAVEKINDTTLKVSGDMTIKGITKPATFDVTVNAVGEHPMAQKPAVGFDATTVVKRSDFGMDKFVPYVGDEVTISFSAEALQSE